MDYLQQHLEPSHMFVSHKQFPSHPVDIPSSLPSSHPPYSHSFPGHQPCKWSVGGIMRGGASLTSPRRYRLDLSSAAPSTAGGFNPWGFHIGERCDDDGAGGTLERWLQQELDSRGIDGLIYTRYILSLLQQENLEPECAEFGYFPYYQPHTCNQCAKRKQDDLKRAIAVDCLLSAAEKESGGIELLVDELCKRLKSTPSAPPYAPPPEPPPYVQQTQIQTHQTSSKPQHDPAQCYYEAFPALSASAPPSDTAHSLQPDTQLDNQQNTDLPNVAPVWTWWGKKSAASTTAQPPKPTSYDRASSWPPSSLSPPLLPPHPPRSNPWYLIPISVLEGIKGIDLPFDTITAVMMASAASSTSFPPPAPHLQSSSLSCHYQEHHSEPVTVTKTMSPITNRQPLYRRGRVEEKKRRVSEHQVSNRSDDGYEDLASCLLHKSLSLSDDLWDVGCDEHEGMRGKSGLDLWSDEEQSRYDEFWNKQKIDQVWKTGGNEKHEQQQVRKPLYERKGEDNVCVKCKENDGSTPMDSPFRYMRWEENEVNGDGEEEMLDGLIHMKTPCSDIDEDAILEMSRAIIAKYRDDDEGNYREGSEDKEEDDEYLLVVAVGHLIDATENLEMENACHVNNDEDDGGEEKIVIGEISDGDDGKLDESLASIWAQASDSGVGNMSHGCDGSLGGTVWEPTNDTAHTSGGAWTSWWGGGAFKRVSPSWPPPPPWTPPLARELFPPPAAAAPTDQLVDDEEEDLNSFETHFRPIEVYEEVDLPTSHSCDDEDDDDGGKVGEVLAGSQYQIYKDSRHTRRGFHPKFRVVDQELDKSCQACLDEGVEEDEDEGFVETGNSNLPTSQPQQQDIPQRTECSASEDVLEYNEGLYSREKELEPGEDMDEDDVDMEKELQGAITRVDNIVKRVEGRDKSMFITCKLWEEGTCTLGDLCPYLHADSAYEYM